MFRVYLLVTGLLQMWQEIVVYPLVPPALLHVVDEPHQVLRLQHLLTEWTAVLLRGLVPVRVPLHVALAVCLAPV